MAFVNIKDDKGFVAGYMVPLEVSRYIQILEDLLRDIKGDDFLSYPNAEKIYELFDIEDEDEPNPEC